MHLPLMWKFRLLRALRAKGNAANRQVLAAQAKVEGGNARFNPCNTTEPWPGSWPYNYTKAGKPLVRNYATGQDGIRATAATFANGNYNGILDDFREGDKTAKQIITDNASEWDTWGTGAAKMLSVL